MVWVFIIIGGLLITIGCWLLICEIPSKEGKREYAVSIYALKSAFYLVVTGLIIMVILLLHMLLSQAYI